MRQHLGDTSRAEHAREVLLQDGDAALQRLADGDHGLCTDCGAAIAAARLQLAPHAPRCVACESVLERGQARPATM